MVLDRLKIARLPKSRPLTIRDGTIAYTCVLCGAYRDAYSSRVNLPEGCGKACPNCAIDHWWTVRG